MIRKFPKLDETDWTDLPLVIISSSLLIPLPIFIGGILLGSGSHEVRNVSLSGGENLHQPGRHLPIEVRTEERGGLAQVPNTASSSWRESEN